MANTRIMYWGGGLSKLDQVAALSRAPCFDEPQPADILLLHDVLSDQTDRKDLRSKYGAVKRDIKKNAPKDAAIVIVPGQNDDEKVLNEVLGEYVLRGAGEVARRKLFGINTYHGQTELTKQKGKRMPLEEQLLKESKSAEIFVSSSPVPRHYKASLDANKRYKNNPLLHLQDAYIEPWKEDGTSNGQKCKILITPAAVDNLENCWSAVESSVILNAGSAYSKQGSHNAEHQLPMNLAYLIDYDDKEGVSKFRSLRPNGHRLTVFQKPYIFERASAESGITRFNLKVGKGGDEKKKATTVRVNSEEEITDFVKKAEIVYKATSEVNVRLAEILEPVVYIGGKTPKGRPRLPKSRKSLDAIADITGAFFETLSHNTSMERYHVIVSALEQHGTRLKGAVRSHAKRMIKAYAKTIKSNKELYTEVRSLEGRLKEMHEKAVADEKAAKAARKAAREARKKGPKRVPKWKQQLDVQIKLREELTVKLEEENKARKSAEKKIDDAVREREAEKSAREAEQGVYERAINLHVTEKKSLQKTLEERKKAHGEHDRLYDLSDEANKRGISAADPAAAESEFSEALRIAQQDPIFHEKRRTDFLFNMGLAQAKQGDQHLNSDRNIARNRYGIALATLDKIKGDDGADQLADAIRRTVDKINTPKPPAAPKPVEGPQATGSAPPESGKIEQPFDFTV